MEIRKINDDSFIPMYCDGIKTNYIINENGVIKSLNYKGRGKVKRMKQFDHRGYRAVNITINGRLKRTLVHRLVAENFLPNPENLKEVNHIDGIKSHNYKSNLEWVSHKDNMIHAVKNNLTRYNRGEKHHNSTITKKQAKNICKMLEENLFTIDEIAKLNDTTRGVVYSIKYSYTWLDVSSKYNVANHSKQPKRKLYKGRKLSPKLDETMVISICEDLQNTKLTLTELSDKFNIPVSKIETIRYKTAWTKISKNYDFSHRDVNKHYKKYGKE